MPPDTSLTHLDFNELCLSRPSAIKVLGMAVSRRLLEQSMGVRLGSVITRGSYVVDTGSRDKNTNVNTKPLRKTAITLPEDVLAQVDDAARASGESRSRYIARVLSVAVKARRSAQITRRLDELFADSAVAAEQDRSAAELDRVGTRWDDEPW